MVKIEDSGQYSCHAENEAGRASRSMTLTVEGQFIIDLLTSLKLNLILTVPPKIATKGPIHKSVLAGDPIQLPCEATGVPTPRILWQKGTRILTTNAGTL